MSKPRKSSAALAARQKARAKAEEITRRNEELIELAAGFFVHEDKLVQIEDDTEQKIAQLRAQAEEKKSVAKQEAITIVEQMLALGESKKSIGERLGLSGAELKTYLAPVPAAQKVDASKDDSEHSARANSKNSAPSTDK